MQGKQWESEVKRRGNQHEEGKDVRGRGSKVRQGKGNRREKR